MNEDIQFLQDFLSYDNWRIAQLCDQLSYVLERIGQMLRRNMPYFEILFDDENDPYCELVQLLDGNNFKVEYEKHGNVFQKATVYPCYLEIIEVECERECEPTEEPSLLQTLEAIAAEAHIEYEERIIESSEHYDSIFDLYNSAAAANDEVLKPPW